jgi:DNA-binding LacI/PurR family transcriptional regulator
MMKRAGKVAAKLATVLQDRIVSGEIGVGQYFPRLLELSQKHKVSPETARRAMKLLESEHLVCGCRGHGFRVTARSVDPNRAAPVAFVLSGSQAKGEWSDLYQRMMSALHDAARARGWSVLGVGAEGRSVEELVEQLKFARVSGLLLDTRNRPLIEAMRLLGMPTVLIEDWSSGTQLDCVSQDNFGGAFEAAEHLAGRGHKRVGWFGPIRPTPASVERWAAAVGCFRDRGVEMPPELVAHAYGPEAESALRRMLSGARRPTGLLALWRESAALAARVAAELKLVPGRDLEIVGWSSEEQFEEYAAGFPNAAAPATVVWSMKSLAETAMARLGERRARPDLPAARVSVEARLRLPVQA